MRGPGPESQPNSLIRKITISQFLTTKSNLEVRMDKLSKEDIYLHLYDVHSSLLNQDVSLFP